jgi:hypothetical protein
VKNKVQDRIGAVTRREIVHALRLQRQIIVRIDEIGDDNVAVLFRLVFEQLIGAESLAVLIGAEKEEVIRLG